MTLQDASFVANIILAFVAVLGIVYWIITAQQFRQNIMLSRKSLIEAERASRVQALRHIFEVMEQVRDQRKLLEKKIKADPDFDIMTVSDQEKRNSIV